MKLKKWSKKSILSTKRIKKFIRKDFLHTWMFNNENLTIYKRLVVHLFNRINSRLVLFVVHKGILFLPLKVLDLSKFRKLFLNIVFLSFSINLSYKYLSESFRIVIPSINPSTILVKTVSFSITVAIIIVFVTFIIIIIWISFIWSFFQFIELLISRSKMAAFSRSPFIVFIVFFWISIVISG